MNFEIAKKAFPQFVINSLFAVLFLFIIALIGVLHTKHANAEEKVEQLDWTAPDFIPKLMKQCPELPPDALEIARKRAMSADEYRIEVQQSIEIALKRGSSANQARKSAEVMNYISPLLANHPWRKRSPRPPSGLSVKLWAAWYVEQDRLKAEKKQQFITGLKCPKFPSHLLKLSYEEELYPGTYTDLNPPDKQQ